MRLLALYRLAILLGNDTVASRWVRPGPDPIEEEYKKELREALKTDRQLVRASWWMRSQTLACMFPIRFSRTSPSRLLDKLGRVSGPSKSRIRAPAEAKDTRGRWLRDQLKKTSDESDETAESRIASLLEIVSLTHLEQLDTRLRRKPPWRPWRWVDWWRYRLPLRGSARRREFSLSAVRVSKLVARIRIVTSAELNTENDEPTRRRAAEARRRLQRRWPFAANAWRRPARWLRPRHRVADRREDAWQYHYNAACTISRALPSGMSPKASDRSRRESRLIEAGLKQLEEYVHRAGGDQIRAQADWIAREDDDLVRLRETDDYVHWARHHLPAGSVGEPLKPKAGPIETTRLAARIAHGGALTFAARWQARAEDERAKDEEIAALWAREATAWQTLKEIFEEPESWKARWEGIDALQKCLRADGIVAPIDAAHRLEDRDDRGDLTELLDGLRGQSEGPGWLPDVNVESIRSWTQERARNARLTSELEGAAPGPDPDSQGDEARRAFRIWTRLADALEGELNGDGKDTPNALTRKCLDDIGGAILPRRKWGRAGGRLNRLRGG